MKSTTRFSNNKKGLECLNCGQPLHGSENFCPHCSQVNDDTPLSITQFISEFFAGFFSFDSRFFKTIVPLLFKPGKVSKEYIRGKRMKYTNPFKMYLHTSIIFFLLTGLLSTISNYKNLDTGAFNTEKVKDSVFKALTKEGIELNKEGFSSKYTKKLDSIFKLADYHRQFANDTLAIEKKDSLYQYLYDIGMDIKMVDVKIENVDFEDFDFKKHARKAHEHAVSKALTIYLKDNKILYEPSSTPLKLGNVEVHFLDRKTNIRKFISFSENNEDISPAKALDSLGIEKTRLNLFKYQKAQEVNKIDKDKDFRKAYLKSSFSKISIAIFFLLPLLTLIFSLLYIRHPFSYTEHLVVVFSIQTVFFLLLILTNLLDSLLKTDVFINLGVFLIFPFYIYKTLRNFYGQRRFKTIIKFFILSLTSFFLATIGVIVVLFLAFIL